VSLLGLPPVIGHRGLASAAPENTLAGFREAKRRGLEWVELDVQLTSDGQPVVFHDDELDRTTDGHGRLADTPWDVVRHLDAASWFGWPAEPVPHLAEALEVISGLGLGVNIEIKADETAGAATAAAALDLAVGLWSGRAPPLLSSFAESALAEAARRAPDWPRGLLLGGVWGQGPGRARALGCAGLHADHRLLTAARVSAARELGLAVLAYTVNRIDRARRLWGWGVEAVFSDRTFKFEMPV